MTTQDQSECQYQLLANGIYVWTWHRTTTKAIDEFVQELDKLYTKTPAWETLRFIHSTDQNHLPSIAYLGARFREIDARHPQRPHTRSGIFAKERVVRYMINPFLSILPNKAKDAVCFFHDEDYDEAVHWLLKA